MNANHKHFFLANLKIFYGKVLNLLNFLSSDVIYKFSHIEMNSSIGVEFAPFLVCAARKFKFTRQALKQRSSDCEL